MILRSEIKTEVKQLFSQQWKSAILISIVSIIISFTSESWSLKQNIDNLGSINDIDLTFSGLDGGMVFFIINILLVSLVIGVLLGMIIVCIKTLFTQSTDYSFLVWIREGQLTDNVKTNITRAWSDKYRSGIIGLTIMISIYTFLWTLLLIVPGIIKALSYSQAYFIYKDQADKNAALGLPKPKISEVITKSSRLMEGHKMEYFVLGLSFLGWGILATLSFGIGLIWYVPYTSAVYANYYEHLIRDNAYIID